MVKTLKDKNAPKRAKNAYMHFGDSVRAKVQEELKAASADGKLNIADVGRKISEMYKALGEEDKQKFNEMAAEDSRRAKIAMEEYKKSDSFTAFEAEKKTAVVAGGKKKGAADLKKLGEKYGLPKRPMASYFLFVNDNRAALMAKGLKITEVGSEASKMWKAADAETTAKYEGLAKEAKEKHVAEMEAFKASDNGKAYEKAVAEAKASAKEAVKQAKAQDKGAKKAGKAPKAKAKAAPKKKQVVEEEEEESEESSEEEESDEEEPEPAAKKRKVVDSDSD